MARVRALIEPQLLVIPQTNAALNMAADRLAFLDIQDQALLGTSGVHDLSGCVCASAKRNGRPLSRACATVEKQRWLESLAAHLELLSTADGRATLITQLQKTFNASCISVHASEQLVVQQFLRNVAHEIGLEQAHAHTIELGKDLDRLWVAGTAVRNDAFDHYHDDYDQVRLRLTTMHEQAQVLEQLAAHLSRLQQHFELLSRTRKAVDSLHAATAF